MRLSKERRAVLLDIDTVTECLVCAGLSLAERDPAWPSELAVVLGHTVEVHYVYCSPEIRRERLTRRANPRDSAKPRDWQQHIQCYGAEEPPEFPHVSIDTTEMQDT